jgi:nicotinate-nucleotide pyrophosphorylase (carboxylating)
MTIALPEQSLIAADAARSLAEDIQGGDVTAQLLQDDIDSGYVIAKESAVLCGQAWFEACFKQLDPAVVLHWQVAEGARIDAGTVVVRFTGRTRALLGAERSALNFLQTLSATATQTAAFAEALQGSRTRVLDTRKTLPGLRQAQKYAVRVGGGVNHRMGLFDAIMLKENHIMAEGSISAAVSKARALFPSIPVIVEVENLHELHEALACDCTRILIDDFSDADMHTAVQMAGGRTPLEVSGSVSLERLQAIKAAGVDFVSVGALTKHIRAIDFSMRLGNPP